MDAPPPECPECGVELRPVTRPSHSALSQEQFDAVRAGDWFCPGRCQGDRGNFGTRYYWDREVNRAVPTGEPIAEEDAPLGSDGVVTVKDRDRFLEDVGKWARSFIPSYLTSDRAVELRLRLVNLVLDAHEEGYDALPLAKDAESQTRALDLGSASYDHLYDIFARLFRHAKSSATKPKLTVGKLSLFGEPSRSDFGLTRLPSGEWVPDAEPRLLRNETAETTSGVEPDRGEFPEIPWFPFSSSPTPDWGDSLIHWRRCVPVSRKEAGWPDVEVDW